jgi:hypothetical protein
MGPQNSLLLSRYILSLVPGAATQEKEKKKKTTTNGTALSVISSLRALPHTTGGFSSNPF